MRFSERVKQVKKDKGITNEALSEASGIPLGTLGKLLSGFTEEPKLSTAVAIAEALKDHFESRWDNVTVHHRDINRG